MARTVPHRELRNESSRILREVAAGETFEITNHGEVVAVLSPPERDLETHGLRVRRAKRTGGFGQLPRVTRDRASAEILDELREDREP